MLTSVFIFEVNDVNLNVLYKEGTHLNCRLLKYLFLFQFPDRFKNIRFL